MMLTMRRLAALIPVLMFCCGFVPQPDLGASAGEPVPDSLASLYDYTDGIRLMLSDGDTAAGRNMLMRAISRDSAYAPALYMLSTSIETESPAEAEQYARRARLADTTNKWYARQYARMLIINGNYGQALTEFEKIVASEPDDPENYRMLALLYQQHNKPFSALIILDSAEVRFGRIPALSEIKQGLLVGTHQYDRAVAEAEAAAAEAPYDIQSRISLGSLYAATGRDSLARTTLREALAMDSLDLRAQIALAEFYNHRNQTENYLDITADIFRNDAMPVKDKLRQLERFTSDRDFYVRYYPQISGLVLILQLKYPDDAEVLDAYAAHLMASGERERALELYKSRLDGTRAAKRNYEMVIDIEGYLFRRIDSTAKYIAEALRIFPEDSRLYLREGNTLSITGRHVEAEKSYLNALKRADSDSLRSVIHGFIGDTYQMRAAEIINPAGDEHFPGLFKKAAANSRSRALLKKCFAQYDKALQYDPDNAAVLNNYSYFLSEQDRESERAVEMAERATRLSRNNPTYLDTYAWALHKAGRNAEAKRIMQQALSLDRSDSAELQIHYGDILDALGEEFTARIYWRRAFENGYPASAIDERVENQKNRKNR